MAELQNMTNLALVERVLDALDELDRRGDIGLRGCASLDVSHLQADVYRLKSKMAPPKEEPTVRLSQLVDELKGAVPTEGDEK